MPCHHPQGWAKSSSSSDASVHLQLWGELVDQGGAAARGEISLEGRTCGWGIARWGTGVLFQLTMLQNNLMLPTSESVYNNRRVRRCRQREGRTPHSLEPLAHTQISSEGKGAAKHSIQDDTGTPHVHLSPIIPQPTGLCTNL